MKLSRPFGRSVAVLAIGGMVLGACQPAVPTGGSTPRDEPAPPQHLTVGVPALVPTLDPHATAGPYNGLKFALFDTVTRTDSKGSVNPWLATSWRTVEPTVWEFKLRDKVAFSNGEPLDANAIKYSIERIIDPANKLALSSRIPLVTGATVVDPLTVRINSKEPDAILPARLAAIYVVPPGEIAKVGVQQFGLKPVGTGPFRLVEFVSDTRAVFERYGESWRKSKLERLTMLSLPEGSTRIAAVRNGNADLMYNPSIDQIASLERDGVTIAATTFARVHVVSLDQVTEATPLRDKRVRQALNYAVDKEAILKSVYAGRGRVADGQLVGPPGFGYDSTLKAYPYDPAKAKQLLAEAGYANGFTIPFEVSATSNREEGLAIQGYFRAVGVDAQLQVLEQAIWLDRFYGRQKRAPLFMFLPNYFPAMDADFPFQFMKSDSLHKIYTNPEFDRLYSASTTEADVQKRLALLKQMSGIVREEAPVVFGIEPQEIWAHSKRVQGFVPRSDGEPEFETVSIIR